MTSQPPFLALWLGESELGKSLTIGSVCDWGSDITNEHNSILSKHGKECVNADKSKSMNFSVPWL